MGKEFDEEIKKQMFDFIQRERRILALTVSRVAHTLAHSGAYWRILWEPEQSGELGPSRAPAEPQGGRP